MVEKKTAFYAVAYFVLTVLALCCVLPFVLLIMSSLTEEKALIQSGYSFWPAKFGLDSYTYLFRSGSTVFRAYGITVFVTLVGTIAALSLTLPLSYALSRRELPGRNILSFIVFFTMLFNGGLVPTYIMYTRYLHINNTLYALIVPSLLLNAFYVMMMRAYYNTNIPETVIEAARIDGSGEWRTLLQIALPMSIPMIATMTLLIGLSYWNSWRNGFYYLTNRELYSIQNILNTMLQDVQFLKSGQGGSQSSEIAATLPATGIRMSIAVVGVLPVLIIYPVFQRFFVKGITVGAVKG